MLSEYPTYGIGKGGCLTAMQNRTSLGQVAQRMLAFICVISVLFSNGDCHHVPKSHMYMAFG